MIDDKALLERLEHEIAAIEYPDRARGLYRPVAYALESGGKRLRPLLTLATCQACCGDYSKALNQAVGIEMFHNFTLIHDDVMDDSRRRRGRLTVCYRWNNEQAILSGDALLTMATVRVTDGAGDLAGRVLKVFNDTALGVYEGQQLDIENEKRRKASIKTYMKTIELKTSILLGAACTLGAIMGGADAGRAAALYDYGINVGMAFQLRDDWLDVFGNGKTFGKAIGNDILTRKKTWLYINAYNRYAEEIDNIYDSESSPASIVVRVRSIYNRMKLSDKCNALIGNYRTAAIKALDKAGLSADDHRWFATLADSLCRRTK